MPHRKPQLTLTSRLLIRAAGVTENWGSLVQWAIALVSLAAVLSLDIFAGSQVNLLIVYLLVVGVSAWNLGERKGLLFAVMVTIGASIVRHGQYAARPDHPVTVATEAWNAFARLLSVCLIVLLVSGMRAALQLERWRASTDGLTGALNKTSFHQKAMAAIAAARLSRDGLILCYMDLDGFKQVNDRYGHSVGDEILRIFARGAVDAIREDDLFARIGGDEFVALLTIPNLDDGGHIAELVHRRISDVLARTGLQVGCSMGAFIASAEQIEPFEAAVQRADALMYEIKRDGKNGLRIGRIGPTATLTMPDRLDIEPERGVLTRPGTPTATDNRRIAR